MNILSTLLTLSFVFCVFCFVLYVTLVKVLWADKNVDGISDYLQLFHTPFLYLFMKGFCNYYYVFPEYPVIQYYQNHVMIYPRIDKD